MVPSKKRFLIAFFLLCFAGNFSAENNQNTLLHKIERFILLKEKDSTDFYLNQLSDSGYKLILTKINNQKSVSYQEYAEFLLQVSKQHDIDYKLIHSFITENITEPLDKSKINPHYVNIKWLQVSKLRDEVTLEAANKVHEDFEKYVNRFSDNDLEVKIAKLKLDTHSIVMYDIKRDKNSKILCLESLEKARAIQNVELQMVFLYHLSDCYARERNLKDFIRVCEEGLALGKSAQNKSDYYAILENLIDGLIFKGDEQDRVLALLQELYDNKDTRITSYNYYIRVINREEKNSVHTAQILNQFKAKNVLELVEKFKVLVRDLNQHDYARFLKTGAFALVNYGYHKQGHNYKNEEVEIVKSIYSKDLSETLANYKTDIAVKEKEAEIKSQKEKNKIYLGIAILVGTFLILALLSLRKIKKQAKELSVKNGIISKTLKEKELLVKEVHHRVKNNFQIVSSLLELQSKGIEDEKALALANEGKNRVKSMALIHQKLYQNETGLVDFDEYLTLLVKELNALYASGFSINTTIKSENMKFDVDTAIPLGLIINEIITNSYKYAFKANKENKLHIAINQNTDKDFKLIIEDNGPGIPNNLEVKKAKSLGLRLVNRLVKQLHGTLDVITQEGTRFEILFKDINARQLVN